MIKKNFMKKAVVFTAASIMAISAMGISNGDTYAADGFNAKDMDVTGGQKFKTYGDTKEDVRVDIKDGDIWVGDFDKESTGSQISASKIKELIFDEGEDKGQRVMDVRLTNTFGLSEFDILFGEDDDKDEEGSEGDEEGGEEGGGSTEVVDIGLSLKDADDIINESSNIKVWGNDATIENVMFGPNDELVLDVANKEDIIAEGYYWFKLNTSMKIYASYEDDIGEAYVFTYHMVNELEAKGDSTYKINRKDFLDLDGENGMLSGIYGCASIKKGKIHQLVGLYNVIVDSNLTVDDPGKITVGLGESVEVALNVNSANKEDIAYYWTDEYGGLLGKDKTFTIDKVMNKNIGKYYVMVYDGVKLKTAEFELVLDTTKLPTVGYATGVKTAARGTYSTKLSWNKATNATGYVIYKAVSGKWVKVGQTASTSILISKLNAGTNYAFAVKPYRNHYGKIIYAGKHTAINSFTKPANVKKFTTPKRAYTAVTAKWTKVAGATGYVVYRKAGTKWVKLGTTKTNSYTYKNLKRNTSYNIAVRPYKTYKGVTDYSVKNTYGTIRTLK